MIEQIKLGNGYSRSDAQDNHQAFYYNEKEDLVALPLIDRGRVVLKRNIDCLLYTSDAADE